MNTFHATIRNRMLYAVTSHTVGELIRARANPDKSNMGLTTWKNADKGRPRRKSDVGVAENYLGEAEIKELNLIIETFLNTAELRASRRSAMRLAEWETVLDTFLTANELPKLPGAGCVSAKQAEQFAHDRYAAFDEKRKEVRRRAAAEVDELEELKSIADSAKARKKGRGGDA